GHGAVVVGGGEDVADQAGAVELRKGPVQARGECCPCVGGAVRGGEHLTARGGPLKAARLPINPSQPATGTRRGQARIVLDERFLEVGEGREEEAVDALA